MFFSFLLQLLYWEVAENFGHFSFLFAFHQEGYNNLPSQEWDNSLNWQDKAFLFQLMDTL